MSNATPGQEWYARLNVASLRTALAAESRRDTKASRRAVTLILAELARRNADQD